MTENTPSIRRLPTRKPGKLAWKLLLSVIIIYAFSFFRFTAELIYSGINFIWDLYSEPFDENVHFGGLIGAICILLNHPRVIKPYPSLQGKSLIQSGFLLLIYSITLFQSLTGHLIQTGKTFNQVIHLVLQGEQIIIFSGSIIFFQIYKMYILLRKDVRMLFASPSKNIYDNKTAVITGAGSGLGRSLAVELYADGARLALCDLDMAGLQETQQMLK